MDSANSRLRTRAATNRAADNLPVDPNPAGSARTPTTAGRNPVDTMTDDHNQDLYEAMRSDFDTGECALLDDSRSGPTVVRFCRQILGVIDSGAYQERSRPFRTAPQGIFASTRQALRAIRAEMNRRQFWPAKRGHDLFIDKQGNLCTSRCHGARASRRLHLVMDGLSRRL